MEVAVVETKVDEAAVEKLDEVAAGGSDAMLELVAPEE